MAHQSGKESLARIVLQPSDPIKRISGDYLPDPRASVTNSRSVRLINCKPRLLGAGRSITWRVLWRKGILSRICDPFLTVIAENFADGSIYQKGFRVGNILLQLTTCGH
ncbi:hypothetical protein CEXT_326231 [Caerostris extrusa]|uniref:Reverse transcriptase domain-containing protein n=1 Tax=Caerostris extrusa TaxID=172846 RepID=A0AAV4RVL8_CAEEX|nr:hypothetical protein CEXT_326231 [Caerostris extrusa]